MGLHTRDPASQNRKSRGLRFSPTLTLGMNHFAIVAGLSATESLQERETWFEMMQIRVYPLALTPQMTFAWPCEISGPCSLSRTAMSITVRTVSAVADSWLD